MATKLIAPRTGEGVEELTVTNWLKAVGDHVDEMESVVEIETDKVITEYPSPVSGTLLRIDVPVGSIVKVGESMGIIGEDGESLDNLETSDANQAQTESKIEPGKAENTDKEIEEKPKVVQATGEKSDFLSPLVRKMLAEHKLDAANISGTGLGGRITKQDVETYLKNPQPASSKSVQIQPTPSQSHSAPAVVGATIPADMPGTLIPHTTTRRQIAAHMVNSVATSPSVLTVMEVDMSRVLAHRKANKAKFAEDGINLTLTAYFTFAITQAIANHKIVNASWTDEGIFTYNDVNLGMAVAMGSGGLIVPVIHQAQNLSLKGMAAKINDLADRARNKKLKPEEVRGGTFTLTNHGTGGSLFAMPIINQPQLGILGTGTMQKRAVVITDENGNDSIAIRPMVYLSYVFDHRAIDGESGDNFLMAVKKILENWE